jgi:hypothetical protein
MWHLATFAGGPGRLPGGHSRGWLFMKNTMRIKSGGMEWNGLYSNGTARPAIARKVFLSLCSHVPTVPYVLFLLFIARDCAPLEEFRNRKLL